MAPEQELSQRYATRANGRLYSRLEITGRGFVLGAETVRAKTGADEGGQSHLAVRDEARVKALLAAALGRPPNPYALEKMRRAAELWNAGEKARAHIQLAFARRPPCESDEQALLLFLAKECLDRGVPPAELNRIEGARSSAG